MKIEFNITPNYAYRRNIMINLYSGRGYTVKETNLK